MGFADICDLGLGIGPQKICMKTDHREFSKKKKKQDQDPLICNTKNELYPSLTLGLPADHDEAYQVAATKAESADFHARGYSDKPSAVSSFSNSSSIKRERDQFVSEEVDHELEVDKFPSRITDLDEDGNPRKKLRLTKEQSALLEDSFKEHSTLNPKQKQELARKLKLRTRQVEVWFQNRRARTKMKQTEMDCELLKKCCETLTEDNKRLEKELQELKSTMGPFLMQLPAATLTLCPSCERICSGGSAGNGNGSSATAPYFIGSKVHNFHKSNYSFTHPSAAC
ncbi:hypothetical protein L6164_024540 [Bauhinia variegata]|uniref:Uncharacterized protein n=1 Tax=Bauhinia variegata TaxID=167791 RepID=A0ACB9LY45_BAUVA|nr:hypothetical protein L6164_024540 [Bauhinia variegata]